MWKIRPTEMREQARTALGGSWNASALLAFIFILAIFCVGLATMLDTSPMLQLLYLIFVLLIAPFGTAILFAMQDLLLSSTKPTPQSLFRLNNEYQRYLGATVLVFVFTMLWSMLLFVPGLIKSISYSMTFFIMRDNPEMSPNKAIEESMKMMRGHKMELFLLQMSFIGWSLLACLSLCIGFFWLLPYMYTSMATFYRKLKEENSADAVLAEA